MKTKSLKDIVAIYIIGFIVLAGAGLICLFYLIVKDLGVKTQPAQSIGLEEEGYQRLIGESTKQITLPMNDSEFGRTDPFEKL